jgi:5'-3' exonuclease
LSTIFVDFIFVDFDKILDKFIYFFGIFLGNYFLPTLPSWYGTQNMVLSVTYYSELHDPICFYYKGICLTK